MGAFNKAVCDDGNSCIIIDFCSGGKCVGSGILECDDNNLCTSDICTVDGCKYENLDIFCSDGDSCILGDSCVVAHEFFRVQLSPLLQGMFKFLYLQPSTV